MFDLPWGVRIAQWGDNLLSVILGIEYCSVFDADSVVRDMTWGGSAYRVRVTVTELRHWRRRWPFARWTRHVRIRCQPPIPHCGHLVTGFVVRGVDTVDAGLLQFRLNLLGLATKPIGVLLWDETP